MAKKVETMPSPFLLVDPEDDFVVADAWVERDLRRPALAYHNDHPKAQLVTYRLTSKVQFKPGK